jgi:hypothetical protein
MWHGKPDWKEQWDQHSSTRETTEYPAEPRRQNVSDAMTRKGRRRENEAANAETTPERKRAVEKHIGLRAKKDGQFDDGQAESQ